MRAWTSRITPDTGTRRGERPRWRRAGLLVPFFALAACRPSWAESAGAKFAEDISCPARRVTVATRFYQPPHVDPPPYITSDPERLAMWQAKEDALERPRPYFVASGCGEEHTYYCERTYTYRGRPDHVCAAVWESRWEK